MRKNECDEQSVERAAAIEQARQNVAPQFAWMLEFVGSIDGLPEDFAQNHDEYLYRGKKW